MVMSVHRVVWTGTPVVGSGISLFHFGSATPTGVTLALKDFFTTLKATCPSGITWTIDSAYTLLDETNGDIVDAGTDGTTQTVTSGGTGTNFANGVGYRIVWNTGGIFHNRRVKGSTFIVPLVADYLEGASNISSVAQTAAGSAAATLIASGHEMVVWSRGEGDGEKNAVLSATVPDKVSWLRSRRT